MIACMQSSGGPFGVLWPSGVELTFALLTCVHCISVMQFIPLVWQATAARRVGRHLAARTCALLACVQCVSARQFISCVMAGDGSAEDRPAPGRTYLCRAPGGFKLLSGRLRPFPRARAASTMLVRHHPDHPSMLGVCDICGF